MSTTTASEYLHQLWTNGKGNIIILLLALTALILLTILCVCMSLCHPRIYYQQRNELDLEKQPFPNLDQEALSTPRSGLSRHWHADTDDNDSYNQDNLLPSYSEYAGPSIDAQTSPTGYDPV